MKRHLGTHLIVLVLFLSLLIGCSSTPDGTATGDVAGGAQSQLGGSSGGSGFDFGGGAGPAGTSQSAGSAPSQVGTGLDAASTAIGNTQTALENAGTTFTPDQIAAIDNVQNHVSDLADFYRTLQVNANATTVAEWLKNREDYYKKLRDLAKEAENLHLKWLADIASELGNRVDIMRFYSPTLKKSAFIARPPDAQTLLILAAVNGYYFTGISTQMWGQKINVAGVNADKAVYQCFSPAWKLFFPLTDTACGGAGNVNAGLIGYIASTRADRASTPLLQLVNAQVQDVIITRNTKEAIALMNGFGYKYVGKLGYVP